MSGTFCYFTSSIGRKFLMAVSGLGLIAFIIAHLLGNLQIFEGSDAINSYAAFLKGLGPGLWIARIGMLTLVGIHFWSGITLAIENRRARPKNYEYSNTVQASIASRGMVASGLMLLAFIVLHLAHFTMGLVQPEYFHFVDAKGRHDVYRMVLMGFNNGLYVAVYVTALIFLGFHLSHALSSCLQTLGLLYSKKMYCWAKAIATVLAIIISIGYISIPLSIYFGFVTL